MRAHVDPRWRTEYLREHAITKCGILKEEEDGDKNGDGRNAHHAMVDGWGVVGLSTKLTKVTNCSQEQLTD